jgi:hypothetical protein
MNLLGLAGNRFHKVFTALAELMREKTVSREAYAIFQLGQGHSLAGSSALSESQLGQDIEKLIKARDARSWPLASVVWVE